MVNVGNSCQVEHAVRDVLSARLYVLGTYIYQMIALAPKLTHALRASGVGKQADQW